MSVSSSSDSPLAAALANQGGRCGLCSSELALDDAHPDHPTPWAVTALCGECAVLIRTVLVYGPDRTAAKRV